VKRFPGLFLTLPMLFGLWSSPSSARIPETALQEPGPDAGEEPPTVSSGTVFGHVALPADLPVEAVSQAILLSPEWSSVWNREVQERIRVYFATNATAVDEDRSLFDRIAYRARMEATAIVVNRMQGTLGTAYAEAVREVGDDGTFEWTNVGFGEYQVVVVSQGGGASYLWAELVRVSSPSPEFVEMEQRFQ
jgi:hypothetical protein